MQQSVTAVLERHAILSGQWATEPYETAWAGEALFFIRIEAIEGGEARVDARVQISPDGIHWADEGSIFPEMTAEGQYFLRVKRFGGWLRLAGQVKGPEGCAVQVTIHLVLKES
ncbi:MAG: hypothetical protein IT445_00385 [Phycisphaeraceae bacterium]|nr:hypothetical protein [Phycisphaeraceae bacterium]